MQIPDYQAFVVRREPFAGRDFYAILENERTDVLVSPQQAPIPPAQSEVAGPTRHARAQIAFFFHRARPLQEFQREAGPQSMAPHPLQAGRLGADMPYGTEQQNIAPRINIARRPAKPYGNRHVLRT